MWVGSSAGFKCMYFDRRAQAKLYDSLIPRVCRDVGVSSCDHPGCDTWREVPVQGDLKALHFLIGNNFDTVLAPDDIARLDEIHMDWTSPVSSVDGGQCATVRLFDRGSYAPTYKHVKQAIFGFGNPTSPFKFDDLAADVEARDDLQHKLTVEERTHLRDLRQEWKANARIWACQGQAGWELATPYLQQVQECLSKFR